MYIHGSPKLLCKNILYVVSEPIENKCYLIQSKMVADIIYCGAAAAEKSVCTFVCNIVLLLLGT